jgi:hypothetical protein
LRYAGRRSGNISDGDARREIVEAGAFEFDSTITVMSCFGSRQ